MAYTKYSLTPANNNAAPPDGAPEGMLPSAVNDTMRDMMSQIRDCGDGIRGGTYTMTAPVITGGSINGATVGATTASTGAFTTLSATGVTTVQAGSASAPAIVTSGDTNTGIWFPAADTIAASTGGSERLRIDTSGNVGIGTSSPVGKLDVLGSVNNSATGLNSNDASTVVVRNSNAAALQIKSKFNLGVTDGSGTYGYASIAGIYSNYNGSADIGTSLAFGTQFNAAGGTVERMRIDSSGYVLINTTTNVTNAALQVSGSISAKSGNYYASMGIDVAGAGSPNTIYGFDYDTTNNIMRLDALSGGVAWRNIGLATRGGSVGIGTSSPVYKLNVSVADTSNTVGGSAAAINITNSNTAAFGRTADLDFSIGGGTVAEKIAGLSAVYTNYSTSVGGALAFCTNNGSSSYAERMRIDSSGNLLVNATSIYGKITSQNAAAQYCYGTLATNQAGVYYHANFTEDGTQRGSISSNGTTTSYNTSSDQRLKENIVDASTALPTLNAIQIRSFDWIESKTHQDYGVIAQEIVEIAPYAVTKGITLEDMMQVDYSKLVPLLTKAIQEQQVMIEELKAKVAALEAA